MARAETATNRGCRSLGDAGEYGLLTFGQNLDAFFVAELDTLVWKRPADADQIQRLQAISHLVREDTEMLDAHC